MRAYTILVLAIQLASLIGAIFFIMWTPVYDVVILHKSVLQSLNDGYYNVIYTVISFTIFVYSAFYLKRALGRFEPMTYSVKFGLSEAISYALLALGTIALVTSIVYSSPVLAFIGLGLTFWGAVLLFIKPTKYVRASLLDSTSLSYLKAINQIITSLNYNGKAIYLPPKYIKTPKGGTVFIPSKKELPIPPAGEIAQEKVFVENPQGMCVTPPGLDLANLYEKELGKDFVEVDLNYLQNNLPKLLIDALGIVEDLEISAEDNRIKMRTTGSIYKKSANICSSIGCPLCSSIAISISRAMRKPVIIEKTNVSESETIEETYYRILEE